MKHSLDITRLGARGDGVADAGGAPVHVPFTAPGDRISVEIDKKGHGRLIDILTPSPHRSQPPCPVFGICGGCALQHISADFVAGWKREKILTALSQRGIEGISVAPTRSIAAGLRRRARLSLRRHGKAFQVGFMKSRSHDMVAIDGCPALHPELSALIPALAGLAAPLMPRKGEMGARLTRTDSGIDLDLSGGCEPDGRQRLALASESRKLGLARLTLDGEPLAVHRKPVLIFGKARTPVPPAAFLQASAEGEQALQELVIEAAAGALSIGDLFCGMGTFSLPLAERAQVFAADADRIALDALRAGVNATPGLKPVVTERRDLMRHPLSPDELGKFDCVVFDPPRAGADDQSQSLARSKVQRIIAVSCNPASFARDARTLIDGGYDLKGVTPVDQFAWSAHIELVGVFERAS